MRIAVIGLSLISVLALIGTAFLGLKVKGGADNLRNAHFHMAMTMTVLASIAHILSAAYAAKTGQSESAES